MTPRPDTVLLTRDDLAHAACMQVLPAHRTDHRTTFSTALLGITADTRTLILDAAAGVPMAHLLASLFLDQQPGRRAVIIEPAETPVREELDPRVQVIRRPLTPTRLAAALERASEHAALSLTMASAGLRRVSAAVPAS